MPRIPVAIQRGNFGTSNVGAPATGRSTPLPTVKMPAGVAQFKSRFTGMQGLDPNVARQLDALQDYVAQAMRVMKAVPFLDGNLVQGLTFTGGATTLVQHGLGRAWRGVIMMLPQGAAGGPFETIAQSASALEARQVQIKNNGATCTVDLWIY